MLPSPQMPLSSDFLVSSEAALICVSLLLLSSNSLRCEVLMNNEMCTGRGSEERYVNTEENSLPAFE